MRSLKTLQWKTPWKDTGEEDLYKDVSFNFTEWGINLQRIL